MSVQVKGSGTIGGIDEGLVVSGIVTATKVEAVGNNNGGKFGQLQIGYDPLNLTVQPLSGHNVLHLNYNNGTEVHIGDQNGSSLTVNGNIIPKTNSARDLGALSKRFSTIYADDLTLSTSTALSSPSTGYKRISIGNNLILNANASAGGYTGFQNNAYINSSGQWVRVNNDFASSIGMDDGNFYFRNVGAGSGTISWSTPLQINANGASTFGSTLTVNGYVLSQGSSGRGGIFGQIKVGHENLYNTIQNAQSNTPIHLQYNNSGDIKCNEGGGDMQTRDIYPETNGNYSLGTNTKRWANIHTNDLNLSNEGNVNEVDGTWGNYTIQEGESNLFLINRRNGKRYKFNLTEID
tara:strand:- start:1076 stop:2128 length:1053 start_codon:yes stop_codon:yes gene_type:complete